MQVTADAATPLPFTPPSALATPPGGVLQPSPSLSQDGSSSDQVSLFMSFANPLQQHRQYANHHRPLAMVIQLKFFAVFWVWWWI